MEGDTKKEQVLTEARAMVVREYLVENFGFDDSLLKTLGKGKQSGANLNADWGVVQILVFPTGTQVPADKTGPSTDSSAADVGKTGTSKATRAQEP